MHGIRVALIMRIFTLTSTSRTSPSSTMASKAQLLTKIFTSEINDALRTVDDLPEDPRRGQIRGRFGGSRPMSATGAEREHEQIFQPISGLYAIRRLSSVSSIP